MWSVCMSGCAAIVLVASVVTAAQQPLMLERSVGLPRVEGRIGPLSMDVAHDRLFVAALGNGSVEVVNVASGTRERSLVGFPEPQGLQVVPGQGDIRVAK